MRKGFKFLALILCLMLVMCTMAGCGDDRGGADGWTPSRTVEYICFYSAGGSTDLITRAIADNLDLSGQASTVSNITGGNTMIGMTDVMNGDDSGHRICLFSPETMASYQATGAYEGNDYLNEVQWLPIIANDPMAVYVSAKSDINSIEDLIADADGEQIWAGPGTLGGSHLSAINVWDKCGIWEVWVPYAGNADSRTAVLGGNADVWIGFVSEGVAYVESGDLKCIGVCSSERSEFLPDVPTFLEKGYDVTTGAEAHRSCFLPAGASEEVVDYYVAKTKEMYDNPEFIKYMKETLHFSPMWMDVEDVKALGDDCYDTFKYLADLWNSKE